MTLADSLRFAIRSVAGFRLRSALVLTAMAMGVASVLLLTALGDAARRYVVGQFSTLGTNLIIVLPGRNETAGGPPPMVGATPRDLTLDDARAVLRSPHVMRLAPIVIGGAPVSFHRRERDAMIIGTNRAFDGVRKVTVGQGRFLPELELDAYAPVAVIGAKIASELFGTEPPLGRWLRIGERRFRVVGVLADEGRALDLDMDEVVIVPVASAQALFNTPALFRILVEARDRTRIDAARDDIRRIIRERHEGEEDVTLITQDAVLSTFDRILGVLTLAVAGIAAVSLAVAGILIMNVMLVAVASRTAEIGLLRALGAEPALVRRLFLIEAACLSVAGGIAGLGAGAAGEWGLRLLFPDLPLAIPLWAGGAVLGLAAALGALFGFLPARRAARLDPVAALARH